jgi:hypothetical protein
VKTVIDAIGIPAKPTSFTASSIVVYGTSNARVQLTLASANFQAEEITRVSLPANMPANMP